MDVIDILFRLAGGFYLVAGWFALRAILMDSVLDKALAALSAGKEDPTERRRRWVVGTSTVAVGASGAALALMSSWALPLFLAGTAAQAVWIAGARRFFIAAEDDDEASRRQVVNAAILYAAVTVGVVWLWGQGRLSPWDDATGIAGTALAALGLALWFVHHMSWKAASPLDFGAADHEDDEEAAHPPLRIVIEPEFGWNPLIDADRGRRFSHLYWVEEDLAHRIEEWDDAFQGAFTFEERPQGPYFASPESEAAWRAEGLAIAGALKELYGPDNVTFGGSWNAGPRPDA